MPCAPLLQGITDPLEILGVLRDHPILLWSEPPQTIRPLEALGWVTYRDGHWSITDEGRRVMPEKHPPEPQEPPEFFDL